ncbi:ABC transporter substrate-binding protein [Cohnella sp. GCM10012308]|uniref:ABC transporter substrate-binding protein n=1 Tax=Cohnella sp. GCM10012308 TaxID=3317329 RepID=UPI003620E9E5
MKKRTIRLTGAVLSALMLGGALSACGNNNNDNGNAASSSAPPQQSSASASASASDSSASSPAAQQLDPVTLKIYFAGDKRPATDEVWKAVEDKVKDTLNAKFEINFIPFNDYATKIKLLATSGDNYDLNFDADWLAYPQMVNNYLDIKDLLPKFAPNYYEQLQSRNLVDSITSGGKITAMPWTQITNDHAFVSVDFKKSGLEGKVAQPENGSIKTVEELDAFLQEAKKAAPNSHILEWDGGLTYSKILSMLAPKYNYADPVDGLYGLTYKLDDPAMKLIPVEQTDWYKEAVTWAKKWADQGIIPADLMINRDAHAGESSNLKVVGFNTNEYINFNDFLGKPENFYSEMYPEGNYQRRSPLANMMAINKNAKNPERALMFMDLMATDQSLYDMVLFGIEGKTYVKNGDTFVYPEGMTAETSNYMDWQGQWGFWRDNLVRPTQSRTADGWKAIADFTNQPNSLVSGLTGFFPTTDAIKNEIAKRTALTTEAGKPLMYGIVKDADKALADYIEKQKKAGTDKIVAEIQKQADAFLAAKK